MNLSSVLGMAGCSADQYIWNVKCSGEYVACTPVALEYDPAAQAEQTEDEEDPAIAGQGTGKMKMEIERHQRDQPT